MIAEAIKPDNQNDLRLAVGALTNRSRKIEVDISQLADLIVEVHKEVCATKVMIETMRPLADLLNECNRALDEDIPRLLDAASEQPMTRMILGSSLNGLKGVVETIAQSTKNTP